MSADSSDTTTADLLDEYGDALRGFWGGIDGRSEKRALRKLSDAIRVFGSSPLPPWEVGQLRNEMGLCPLGKGHWAEFCTDFGCEVK